MSPKKEEKEKRPATKQYETVRYFIAGGRNG